MKFLKYLIFIALSITSLSVFAVQYWQVGDYPLTKSSTKLGACKNAQDLAYAYRTELSPDTNYCFFFRKDGSQSSSVSMMPSDPPKCDSEFTKSFSGYIRSPSLPAPSSICSDGCTYIPTSSSGELTPNGNIVWGLEAKGNGQTCSAETSKGVDTPQPTEPEDDTKMKAENCRNQYGSDAYCSKVSGKDCPTGYKQGSFNNQVICIKNSSNPTNPNDPNNPQSSNFDDTRIIDAINQLKKSMLDAITNATNSLKESINAINQSTSNVINSITNIGSSITNAVNNISSTLSTSDKDNSDKIVNAVNANGQKITDAANQNGDKAVNAVNSNAEKTKQAIESSAEKSKQAVDKNTDATKENGEKLDGIKDGVEDGNGILEGIAKTLSEIKDWLTKEPELETGQLEIHEETLPGYERKDYVQFTNTCPFTSSEESLPMGVLGTITFTKDLTFICTYGVDARPYIIGLGYLGALIYLLYGLRSRNG